MDKIEMPYFENEAAEAKWWYDNREEHAEHWIKAIREGHAGEGSVSRYGRKVREAEAAKAVSGLPVARRGLAAAQLQVAAMA